MKTKRDQLEAKIRDWLANNLSFISDDLQLIQKEYHLQNTFGSTGFIDILAKDRYNNSVIIEIKRSNATARQAIHEILKYASLLKQNFKIKDSEIKAIIISTEWRELLVPYSDFYHDTAYTVEAFKIFLDENDIPVRKELVQLLRKQEERNVSPKHMIYLYRKRKDMLRAAEEIREKMKGIGIPDFVVLAFVKPEPRGNVISPYGAYLVFQRYSIEFYCSILSKDIDFLEELEALKDNAASEDEILSYLEDRVLEKLMLNTFDDIEISYPEKLMTQIEIYNWQIDVILKEGIFATDPRIDNQMVVNEILGLASNSTTHYANSSNSKMKARIKEIKQDVTKYLDSEHRWLNHIQFAFSDLDQKPEEYDITLEIYNPPVSILETLFKIHNWYKFGVADPILFIPNYVLRVDFSDRKGTSLIQIGRISWDGRKRSLEALQRHVLGRSASWYVTSSLLNATIRREYESEIMQFLGFGYVSDVFIMSNGHRESLHIIEDNEYYSNPEKILYLEDFVMNSREFLDNLDTLYGRYFGI